MRTVLTIAFAALMALAGTASAQTSEASSGIVMFPGSLNVTVGTIAPSESGNVIASATVEQGVMLWRRGSTFVVGFVDLAARHDSDGLAWNRTSPYVFGTKLVSVSRIGVVQAAIGVSTHSRGGQLEHVSKALYANYWNSWRVDTLPVTSRFLPDALPGYTWASSGFVTAAEPNNWITSAAVQQGATMFRAGGAAVIPFVGGSANADTAGYDWNNRVQMDAGVKVARSVMGGVLDAGVAHRHEFNRLSRTSHAGPMVFVNFWLGWTPRHVKR